MMFGLEVEFCNQSGDTLIVRGSGEIIDWDGTPRILSRYEDVTEYRRSFIPPHIGVKLAERMSSPVLSKREREILELISVGMSNLEIGTTLQIAEGTVKSHMNNILSKLNVSDRTQAVMVALKRGLISLPEN